MEACKGDKSLYKEVLSLLQAHAKTDGLLDAFALDQANGLIEDLHSLPSQIGPYTILSERGEGGMGRVFHARRNDGQFEREVALKVLRPGLGSKTTIQRFLHERQILARLQHPHIARLLDGGIDENGQPYFAMDYVDGQPITNYCDEHKLNLHQRLQLFLDVCYAVQYAHRNLVVHRDLKPGNILVNKAGDVKLLDFGIARVLDGASTTHKALTVLPALTPEYAAPEQVRGIALTTAVDVYTLGIILHEMLTGCRPYDLESHSLEAIVRAVCETHPEHMSVQFDGLPINQQQQLAAQRDAHAGQWKKLLHGDLDAIVNQALQKEPEHRYNSVDALAVDIQKYLAGQPVAARQGKWWYLTKKYVSRHKAGIALAAVVFISIGLLFFSERHQAQRIAAERDIARQEAVKAAEVSRFLESVFAISNPDINRGETITARELLDAGAARIEHELKDQPAVQAHMRSVLGGVYSRLRLKDEAVSLLKASLAQQQSLPDTPDSLLAQTHADLAIALEYTEQFLDEAAFHHEKALTLQKNLYGGQHINTLRTRVAYSLLAHRLRKEALADSLRKETINAIESDTSLFSSLSIAHQIEIGKLYYYDQNFSTSQTVFEALLVTLDTTNTADIPWAAEIYSQLAKKNLIEKNYKDHITYIKQAIKLRADFFGDQHPSLAPLKQELASSLSVQGRFQEAITIQKEALEELRNRLGDNHQQVGYALLTIARAFNRNENYAGSVPWYQKALPIFRQDGENSFAIPIAMREMGIAMHLSNDHEQDERILEEAFDLAVQVLGKNNPLTYTTQLDYGKLLSDHGNMNAGMPHIEAALAYRLDHYGPDHKETSKAHFMKALALGSGKKYAQAGIHLEEVLRILDGDESADSTLLVRAREILESIQQEMEKVD